MVYRFADEISTESINELISFLSQHESVHLYFSTHGGGIPEMRCLIHYLNERKGDIKVYLDFICHSAGTLLLTEYEGNIVICPMLDSFYFHRWDEMTYRFRRDDAVYDYDREQVVSTRIWENYLKDLKKLGLSKKQLKTLKENKPLYIYPEDMKKYNFRGNVVFLD